MLSTADRRPAASSSERVDSPPPVHVEPVVLSLDPELTLWLHEASSARTELGPGRIDVVVPVDATSTVRAWSAAEEVVNGTRLVDDAHVGVVSRFPIGTPIVVSYDSTVDGVARPVSLFGFLATPADATVDEVRYTVEVLDAPGRTSTYSVAGNYDIPEAVDHVRVHITTQQVVSD